MLKSRLVLAAAGALAAAALGGVMFGFTVDDALIPARYAHHLATDSGYAFNRGGPSTDGVTPLGFAHLLAPFARAGAQAAHEAAKILGLAATAAGGAAVLLSIQRVPGARAKWSGAPLFFASAPVAAWSGAGLETGLVVGLVAVAIALRSAAWLEPLGPALFGLAAALRPEVLPLAMTLGVPRAPGRERLGALGSDQAARAAIVGAPFGIVALIRWISFGWPAPLSSLAKAPDPWLGFQYAFACFLVAGPLVLTAPLSIRRAPRFARWMVFGVFVHLASIALAGGDWMPLSRLLVPAVPVVAIAAAELAAVSSIGATSGRTALALAGQIFVWVQIAPRARHVESDRQALIDAARPTLDGARGVAGLDVGWLGVAAPGASIVDLAGVTDPSIAKLPGGHTTKRLPPGSLDDRGVDTLVLMLEPDVPIAEPWIDSKFSRGGERYAAIGLRSPDSFDVREVRAGKLRYVVARRR